MGKIAVFLILGTCLVPFSMVSSCSSAGPDSFLQRTSAAAKDHIMLVRQEPPTFGFRRLVALADLYPDLGLFLRSKGMPGYFAETTKGQNRYLILYYPEIRQAFACRSGASGSRQVEFSGPYPITDNELRTLRKLETGTKAEVFRREELFFDRSN